jgi:TonB family protein
VVAVGEAQEAPKVAGTDVPPPKRTKLVLPEYPPEAQERGQHGIVILELRIDTEGRVAEARVIRSIPPFDAPALAAAQKWEYEVTRVDGKPVEVLLTVPITFALRVPEVSRQEGIPELRGGVSPVYPKGARGSERVVLLVNLDAEGRISDAEMVGGEEPYRAALLNALRTWRFAPPGEGVQIAFRIEAEFEPRRRDIPERVAIRLSGLRRSEAPEAAAVDSSSPSVQPEPERPQPAEATEPAAQPPATPPAIDSPATPDPAEPIPAPTPMAPPPPAAPAQAPQPPQAEAPAAPVSPAPQPTPGPAPLEVLTAPPPPVPPAPPPKPGSSAIENVTLGIGVPDLAQGRRPVVPPFARMQGVSGSVEVRFAVNAAGQTAVHNVEGPDTLKPAAQGAVASWGFRRTSPERVYLTAVFVYENDSARASVTTTPESAIPRSAPAPAAPASPPVPPPPSR